MATISLNDGRGTLDAEELGNLSRARDVLGLAPYYEGNLSRNVLGLAPYYEGNLWRGVLALAPYHEDLGNETKAMLFLEDDSMDAALLFHKIALLALDVNGDLACDATATDIDIAPLLLQSQAIDDLFYCVILALFSLEIVRMTIHFRILVSA
jgi:hypothetical protein